MIFTPLPLTGAYIVDVEPHSDERGFFARTFCAEDFRGIGLNTASLQCSVSFNVRKGTLRGMHYQSAPYEEDKLVRCTAGAIFDVIVDIRRGSASYGQWYGAELSADNRRALYAPGGFAHGFISLCDAAEVFYMISARHTPEAARGFVWDDTKVGIVWPLRPAVISARDAALQPLDHGGS
jgi:dTDP-4-dehydrorhamnose 3,5-epimerase